MSDPVFRCQAKWNGEHCNGDGVRRFMVNNHPFSLAGVQMKVQANEFYICDDCWPRAKVFLLQQLGHPEDVVRKAAEEAGLEISDA